LPRAVKPRRALALTAAPTEDAMVVDPDALEFGVTEMVPTIRKPRWTPEMGLSSPAEVAAARPAITPKSARDEVAGEIAMPSKRR
jgi:hypothetical protein